MNNKKKLVRRGGLGKGLNSLISSKRNEPEEPKVYEDTSEILVKDIEKSPFQPRKNFDQKALVLLSESIKQQGLIQPITVRKTETGFQLISGERRLQATKMAGIKKIPAHILEVKDQEAMEMSLIENIQREDLNALEIAESYKQIMIVLQLNQEELAERVGKDRATVANYLRLFNLPEDIREAVRLDQISMGHARALLGVSDLDSQLQLFEKVKNSKLSVRELEKLVKGLKEVIASKENSPRTRKRESFKTERQLLEKRFGSKVNLVVNAKGKGRVKISYQSEKELNQILSKLKKD